MRIAATQSDGFAGANPVATSNVVEKTGAK
jgi:hypothetical protein